MDFSKEQLDFILDCVAKELYCADPEQPTRFVKLIAELVELEVSKIEIGIVDCHYPDTEIAVGQSILEEINRFAPVEH